MTAYRYKARDARGQAVEGVLEGSSADAIATQLMNSGITPIDIAENSARSDVWAGLNRQLATRKPSLDELALFSRQMYTLMRAGVPIIRALSGLAETTRNPTLAETIGELVLQLESGRDLTSAMGHHPQVFSSLMVSMVQVGETTGRLDEAFRQLAQYLESEKEVRDQIKGALRYPATVLIFILAAIAVINVQVIPQFAKMFASFDTELPLATRILVATSDFFVAFWPHLLIMTVLGALALRAWIGTEPGRYKWDRFKLHIPYTGSIIRRASLARFARAFSMALSSGVPLIQALTVTARAVDNAYIGERVLMMRNGVEKGDALTRTAAATGLFTPLVLQMLAVGEETGVVEEMLDQVGEFYEREVAFDLKRLSAALEPALIVIIGAMVLVLMLGVFLPLWDMASLARGQGG